MKNKQKKKFYLVGNWKFLIQEPAKDCFFFLFSNSLSSLLKKDESNYALFHLRLTFITQGSAPTSLQEKGNRR